MAKGFGKFLFGTLVAGAAAAGVYYWLKSQEELEDFDDFDDDVNDDGHAAQDQQTEPVVVLRVAEIIQEIIAEALEIEYVIHC